MYELQYIDPETGDIEILGEYDTFEAADEAAWAYARDPDWSRYEIAWPNGRVKALP
jgi:hypothetical protein